jgi:hypothetical protein
MTLLRKCLPALLLAASACADSSRPAMGDVNSIIVVAADSLWSEVSDTVLSTLQPRVFAVRDEPTFQLTHTTPGSEHWGDLQRFRQLLVIGRPDDPWVADVLEAADVVPDEGGAIVESPRVWARNQHVTAVVVPESDPAGFVLSAVDSLASLLDYRYRTWASTRMYISGHDSALVDTLRAQAGFVLDVPEVYRWRRLADNAYAFLNDNPDASQLVRWLTVTWNALPETGATEESVLAWRDSIAASLYDWGQSTGRERVESTATANGIEVRGVWSGLDEFPQAGPFIARTVDCPAQNRRYLLDAWLYAPARDKYQYMIQLETLLESFGCGG